MSCPLPYIRSQIKDVSEAKRLEDIHSSIGKEALASKAFKRETTSAGVLYSTYKAMDMVKKARAFIAKINEKYGQKVAWLASHTLGRSNLMVNVLPLSRTGKQENLFDSKDTNQSQGNNFFQIKNIFNSVKELNALLVQENKTAASIGNEDKLDKTLKKAGIDSELRKQFIQLIRDTPELKKVKLRDVIGTYVKQFVKDSDKAYYTAIDAPLSKELEKLLIDNFKQFHINIEQLDSLKDKFGVDSVGVFDVLSKTIYLAKNRNLLTTPEEFGHVFVELLGSLSLKKAENPLFQYLYYNIENWDGYKRVLNDYRDKYVTAEGFTDIYKIKKEAIGQAIGIALVRNYKNNKNANKSIWDKMFAKDTDFWTKIQEVIDYLYSLLGEMDYVNINLEADKIAKNILSGNFKQLDRLQKDTSNYKLQNYADTIKEQNKKDGGRALKFMQWFSNRGMIITGSLAYRLQGNTYRPQIDALHDIDNIVPSDVHGMSLDKRDYLNEEQLAKDTLYRKYQLEQNWQEAKKYKLTGNLKLNMEDVFNSSKVMQDFKKEFPDTDFLYSFFNQKPNAFYITINAIWSEDQSLKDRFKSYSGSFNKRLDNFTEEEIEKMYLFDFFLRPEKTEDYKGTIKEEEFGLTLAHYNYAFYEKLNMMGRPKDAYDYQNWEFFDKSSIIAPDLNDRMVYYQLAQEELKEKDPIVESTYTEFKLLKQNSNISEEDWKNLTPSEQEMLIYQAKNCG